MLKNPIICATSKFHYFGGDEYKLNALKGCELVNEDAVDMIAYMNNEQKLTHFSFDLD
jgi:hypothetical protein